MAGKAAVGKTPWFDAASDSPLLAEYARKLDSFLDVVADGRVDVQELEAQEKRLVALMREVEPLLSPEAHEKVTQLLCEVTAYDLMNTFHMAGKARPKTKFRG
jgi:PHD/YefM family antitoxin component YafN of YafNO toxin-antitoxin module